MSLHLPPRSWYIEEVMIVGYVPQVGYLFNTTMRCRQCQRVRTKRYLDTLLVFRLSLIGLRDLDYLPRATELSEQVRDDVCAALQFLIQVTRWKSYSRHTLYCHYGNIRC